MQSICLNPPYTDFSLPLSCGIYSPEMGNETPGRWRESRLAAHIGDVAFLSSFLALTAIPLGILEFLKGHFDKPVLWGILAFIDDLGTVVIFAMFWGAIILRLWSEAGRRR